MATLRRTLASLTIAGAVLVAAPAVVFAEGEHTRRAGTELLVLAGDARRLANEARNERHRKGLADRIRGGLAGLDLMLRLADEERGRPSRSHGETIAALREALAANDLARFRKLLEELIDIYPFRATGILPARVTPERLRRGQELHEELCAGCHDAPDLEVERPAYNLFEEARALLPKEFAARMVIGVRGDRVTGIDNPLSDEQIASLIAWLRTRH